MATTDMLAEMAEKLDSKVVEKKASINVIIANRKNRTCNPFALMFYEIFFDIIVDYDLSRTDILVLLQILKYIQYGNLISFSQTKLAKDLNMQRQNIGRSIKNLRESGLIVNDDGNLSINPHVIAKGKFISDEEIDLLERTGIAMIETGRMPSILTDKLSERIRQQKSV